MSKEYPKMFPEVMWYLFRVKVLYQGKLRIFQLRIKPECDAAGIMEELEDVLGVERLACTQIVSVERIEDGP